MSPAVVFNPQVLSQSNRLQWKYPTWSKAWRQGRDRPMWWSTSTRYREVVSMSFDTSWQRSS